MIRAHDYLNYLRNHIDITRVPFSDRGSRLLVYKDLNQDQLNVKLAERLTSIDPDIEAYLHRPPFLRDLYFKDEDGSHINFELTTYPHLLSFQTRLGEFGLAFQDERTLVFGLPAHQTITLSFIVNPLHFKVNMHGGVFKSVRNIAYLTTGEVLRNFIFPLQDGYQVELTIRSDADCSFAISIQPGVNLITEVRPFTEIRQAAEQRWIDWFSRIPAIEGPYQRTYSYAWWIMANNLISPLGNVVYEAMTPSKINYVGLWLWDSAMHALAYRHIDPHLARNQIMAMIAHQTPNGMIPDAVFDDGVVSTIDHPITGEVTKPPILAWAILKMHEKDPDLQFLSEVYVPLVRLNAWWFTMNDDDADGLVQYNHPYSSGLDDSPLWDYGMPVESPDLNTYLCIQMNSLAQMADLLGLGNDSAVWRRRSASIVQRMVADMWDEEEGIFRTLHNEKPVPVITPFNLYPLWTGLLPLNIRQRLMKRLTDPQDFWGKFGLSTVSRRDPHFNPEMMWRGPVWANINYFFIEALEVNGYHQLANELCQNTLDLIASQQDIYEYYNAETGQPPARAANIFGWSASVFIDLAIKSFAVQEK